MACERIGPYLSVRDDSGCRHLIRRTAITLLSDEDPVADTTLITVGGRTLRIPLPLDRVMAALDPLATQTDGEPGAR